MRNDEFIGSFSVEDDLPLHSRPSAEGYLENYWWIAHDANSHMGLMVHFGTMRHDFDVIRQTIMIFLPDGRVATDVSYAKAFRDTRYIAAGTLSMTCDVPFRQWKIESSGMLQVSNVEDLWKSSVKQGPRIPGKFKVEGHCLGPVWSASADKDKQQFEQQQWSSSHYQQTIRLVGQVSLDGKVTAFDGTGVRDHSRGPRDLTGSWTGHVLSSAPFPSGRSFGIMMTYGPDNTVSYSSAYVVIDGKMERGVPKEVKRLSKDILNKERLLVEIELDDRTERIEAQTTSCGLLSMLLPCDTVIGIFRDRGIDIGLGYAMATFKWGDEVGDGIIERSSLVSELSV